MDLGLKGKTALVTGGSSGIGFSIAQTLLAEGATVIIASRDSKKIETALRSLNSKQATGKVVDLLSEEKIRAAVGTTPIDILVNNVGGPAAGNTMEISLEGWDKGYQSLLRSVVLLSQLIVPGMKERKWGRILTITSTSAREIIPQLPVSATFRAGLSAWTKCVAKEIGRFNILVNNLLPGPTNTERLKELETKSPAFFKSMQSETAVGRIAEPDEIGRVAAFLCSSANTYITGTDILADGGYTKAL